MFAQIKLFMCMNVVRKEKQRYSCIQVCCLTMVACAILYSEHKNVCLLCLNNLHFSTIQMFQLLAM